MRHISHGPRARECTKRFLEALLLYNNYDLEVIDRNTSVGKSKNTNIQVRWSNEKTLIVKASVKSFQCLIDQDSYPGSLSEEQIKESIKHLKEFIKILEDNRIATRGNSEWHFTLKLWHGKHDLKNNLRKLDLIWQSLADKEGPSDSKDIVNMPEVLSFYGRNGDISILERWIFKERCNLVGIIGVGGVGKTSICSKFVDEYEKSFDCIFWRSLHNAPSIGEIINPLTLLLSKQEKLNTFSTLSRKIDLLIELLGERRSLVILDNFETVMQSEKLIGDYLHGYEAYGELLYRLGVEKHNSYVLLTSREKPIEMSRLQGDIGSVRVLTVSGLSLKSAKQIFADKGFFMASESEWKQLFEHYSYNPLLLDILSSQIRDTANSNVSEYVSQSLGKSIQNSLQVKTLLDQQFGRLSEAEKQVMYWLAIWRGFVSPDRMQQDVLHSLEKHLWDILHSLINRSLVTRDSYSSCFGLQPAIREYVTDSFVRRIGEEIIDGKMDLLCSHALLTTASDTYIRESQIQLIIKSVIEILSSRLPVGSNLLGKLNSSLSSLRGKSSIKIGYAAGNIINIICEITRDLSNYDLSKLPIWQADLRNVNLSGADFTDSDLRQSIFSHPIGQVYSVAFSPDNQLVAVGDDIGSMRLWNLVDDQLVQLIQAHASWIFSVAFSPDGTTVATASFDDTIKIWEVATGRCIHTLQGHQGHLTSVRFSPDGQSIASSSFDRTVKLWSLETGQCLQTLEGHTNWVWSVSFSPDGQYLASGSEDKSVRVWDLETRKCIDEFYEHTQQVWSVAFSPDGQYLASGSEDRTVRVWNLETRECLYVLEGHAYGLFAIAFSPDSEMIASSAYTIRLWSVTTGKCLKTFLTPDSRIREIAFSPNGRHLASGGDDQVVRIWDVNKGQRIRELQGLTNGVHAISFSPDGRYLASSYDNQTIRLWNLETEQCGPPLCAHTNWVWSAVFSPNGKTLASSNFDRTIKLWDVETRECYMSIDGHSNWVHSISFSPCGLYLASASQDQTVKIWCVHTGKCLKTLTGHSDWVHGVAFNTDGTLIASSSSDGTVRLWSSETGECIEILVGHISWVFSVSFSPDGQYLATGSYDGTVRLWDVAACECVKVLEGHTNQVYAVSFSPGGQYIASGGEDRVVRLWNMDGKCLRTLQGHTRRVFSLAFNPLTGILASGSQDETIRFWEPSTGQHTTTMRIPRLYEGMDISGVTGVSKAQRRSLKALGAIEKL